MNRTAKTRAGIIAGVATGALALAALAGTAVATAADGTPSPSTSQSADAAPDRQHTPEEALTGDPAAKVKAAVEAKYPGATIDRMEKDSDGMSVYEAHITKADGTHVTVMLDASFAITGEQAFGGRGGHGGGDHGAARTPEEALTGDPAAKVKAAVEAKYPGATIDRMEKDSDGMSVYEAHITKADGTHVTVMLDASFAITGEQAFGGKGGHGRGDHGRGADAGTAGSPSTQKSGSTASPTAA